MQDCMRTPSSGPLQWHILCADSQLSHNDVYRYLDPTAPLLLERPEPNIQGYRRVPIGRNPTKSVISRMDSYGCTGPGHHARGGPCTPGTT